MSEAKKRKRSYYQGKYGGKKSRYNSDLAPKMKGFIVTTSGKERSATQEAYRLLNEYADKKYGPENITKGDESDSDEGDGDIEAALKKQVTGMKEAYKKGTERRFQSAQNKAKNVIFIKTNLPDPTELVTDIFHDLKTNGVQKTQHCQRLIPVVETCYAKMEHILAAARPLVKEKFHDSVESFSFSIKWKARCNSGLKREEVYAALVKMIWEVEKGHTTDYDHPEVVFNVDVIGNVCCFGFLRNYNKFAKYNVEMVCKPQHKETKDEFTSHKKVSSTPIETPNYANTTAAHEETDGNTGSPVQITEDITKTVGQAKCDNAEIVKKEADSTTQIVDKATDSKAECLSMGTSDNVEIKVEIKVETD